VLLLPERLSREADQGRLPQCVQRVGDDEAVKSFPLEASTAADHPRSSSHGRAMFTLIDRCP
jgi:hypothetical protein